MTELIHFTAVWCQPCKAMAPIIDKYISDNPDIKYTKIDIDHDSENLVSQYEVRGVPTFIVNVDGELKARHTGALPQEKFNNLFN